MTAGRAKYRMVVFLAAFFISFLWLLLLGALAYAAEYDFDETLFGLLVFMTFLFLFLALAVPYDAPWTGVTSPRVPLPRLLRSGLKWSAAVVVATLVLGVAGLAALSDGDLSGIEVVIVLAYVGAVAGTVFGFRMVSGP